VSGSIAGILFNTGAEIIKEVVVYEKPCTCMLKKVP
jgi:hypothetical protein